MKRDRSPELIRLYDKLWTISCDPTKLGNASEVPLYLGQAMGYIERLSDEIDELRAQLAERSLPANR